MLRNNRGCKYFVFEMKTSIMLSSMYVVQIHEVEIPHHKSLVII
jgi:hypothetical protein